MRKIGNFKTKCSRDIAGSKIGVGFEGLDRQMWDDTDEAYRLAGGLGVKHARVQTGWGRCETQKGIYDFTWLDRIVDKLIAEGIQPWFNVGYGNIHYTGAKEPDAVGWAPIYTPQSRQGWVAYVGELVRHFRGRITHYEVWNEPDFKSFWVNGVNACEYMDLLRLTAPVVRENQPDAKIIGGATAFGFSQEGFATLDVYLKNGITELIDVYSYHRYKIVPEMHNAADLRHMREAFDAHGGKHIELWQAESGCPSRPSTTQALRNTPLNEDIQAKILCRSIMTDLDLDLDYTCYFHFSDFKFYYNNGFVDKPNFFGLVTFDVPPRCKPSYYAFQRLCTLFDDDTRRVYDTKVDLALADMDDSSEKYSFQIDIINTRIATFRRKGYPLVSWYQPCDPIPEFSGNSPYQPRNVELYVWTAEQNFKEPVIIDPITGDIFAPEGEEQLLTDRNDIRSQYVLHDVPLMNYPVFVCDRHAVDDLIG